MDTTKLQDKRERKRLYAIKYRQENSAKLKERHNYRLTNDVDYARRYAEKQEKRKHKYQDEHADAVRRRQELRIERAAAREVKERERNRIAKAKVRSENREAYNEYMREYRRKNQDEINAKRRELWNGDLKYRARQKQINLKSSYGLSIEEYADLYIEHNGRCAICKVSEADLGEKGLAVDHCHATGKVRGLLCGRCNTALGLLDDNVDKLQSAVSYLIGENHGEYFYSNAI